MGKSYMGETYECYLKMAFLSFETTGPLKLLAIGSGMSDLTYKPRNN
jgi:hypothetical protein